MGFLFPTPPYRVFLTSSSGALSWDFFFSTPPYRVFFTSSSGALSWDFFFSTPPYRVFFTSSSGALSWDFYFLLHVQWCFGPIPLMQTGAFLPSRANFYIASFPRRWLLISQLSLLGGQLLCRRPRQFIIIIIRYHMSFLLSSPLFDAAAFVNAAENGCLINRLKSHGTL